jgi:hypothetical protein
MADKGIPFDVPTRENLLQGQRLIDEQLREKSARDAKLSPLDKAYAALEAARTFGSGILATVGSLPTRAIKGEDAAQEYINQRMFIPTTEKGMDYVGNVGDFLEQLETKYKLPPVLPEAVALQHVMGPAAKQAAKTVKTNIANMPPSPPSGSLAAQRGVIKMPGGNWLKGNIEPSLEKLKSPKTAGQTQAERISLHERLLQDPALNDEGRATVQRHLDATKQAAALDNWVGGNLTNYVKKQMATPNDPVRALHERGITHLGGQMEAVPMADASLKDRRAQAGFDREGLAQSEMAKQWESLADESIWATQAKEIQKTMELLPQAQQAERAFKNHQLEVSERFDQHIRNKGLSENQIQTLNEKTPISDKARIIGDTKYDDLWQNYTQLRTSVDIPNYAAGKENPWITKVNPETPLYSGTVYDLGFDHIIDVLREDLAAGRIRPEQLNKVSMEQAVRRTYEYDQEMAKKMNESRIASLADLPVYKDYPEGYKWVELNKPGSFANESEAMGHSVRGYEPPKGHPDWVEGSGDSGSSSYGHGGWEAIKSSKAKVYSLVDAKGEPHVTIETKTKGVLNDNDFGENDTRIVEGRGEFGEPGYKTSDNQFFESYADAVDHEKIIQTPTAEELKQPSSITQIKGKQNAAPKKEYLPFVQDFVRSGEWSDVGDLRNTGLIKNDGKYMTQGEYDNYLLNQLQPPPVEGMKRGGSVHIADNPDTMMMEVEDQKFVGGGIAKAIKTAAKSAVATRELEKQAVLRAEAATKSAAKQALMPQYNEAVKGMTQKQEPLSFEEWKAINYPEPEMAEGGEPKPQFIPYPRTFKENADEALEKFRILSNKGLNSTFPLRKMVGKASSALLDNWQERIIEENIGAYIGKHAQHQSELANFHIKNAIREKVGLKPIAPPETNIEDYVVLSPFPESKEKPMKKASGGAVYNTDPDMSDGGRIIEGAPFKRGGNVSLDAMYMAVNDAKFRRK